MLQFTNISSTATPTFSVSTTFTLGGAIDSNNRVGLTASANNTVSQEYLADVTGNGSVRLIRLTQALTTTPAAVVLGNLSVGSPYTMTLTGSYVGTTLNLSFTVSGLFGGVQNSATLSGQDATAPLTGQYFGFRNNNASTAGTALVANFQNFTVVPEPSTTALAALCLGLAAVVRARRVWTARA